MYLSITYTPLGTTNNYRPTYNLEKSPQHPLSHLPACCVISRSLATASNSGNLASRAQVLSLQPPVLNSTVTINLLSSLPITSRRGPVRNIPFPLLQCNFCVIKNLLPSKENFFTEPLPRNGQCLDIHHLATGLYVTISSACDKR
jgi:hypothetical protein